MVTSYSSELSLIYTLIVFNIFALPHPYDLLQSLKFMHKTSVKGPAGMPGLFVNEQFFKTLTLHLASSCHLERVTTEVPGPSSYLWSYEPNTSIESKRFALKGVLGPHVLNQEKRVPRWRNHTCIDLSLNPSRDDYYSWHMQLQCNGQATSTFILYPRSNWTFESRLQRLLH